MDAVGCIDLQPHLAISSIHHFVNRGGTEMPAGIAIFRRAPRMADVRLQNLQMGWLIFVVTRAGMINVLEFVRVCRVRILPPVQMPHARMSGTIAITIAQSAATRQHLQRRMHHSSGKSVFKSLMKIANLPEFLFDPACFHQFLISPEA